MKNKIHYIQGLFDYVEKEKVNNQEVEYKKYLKKTYKTRIGKVLPSVGYVATSGVLFGMTNHFLMNYQVGDIIFNSEAMTNFVFTYGPFIPGLAFVFTPLVNSEMKRKKIKDIYQLSFEDLQRISENVSKTDMEYIIALQKEEKLEEYIDYYMIQKYSNKEITDPKLKNLVDNMYIEKK